MFGCLSHPKSCLTPREARQSIPIQPSAEDRCLGSPKGLLFTLLFFFEKESRMQPWLVTVKNRLVLNSQTHLSLPLKC